MGKLPLEPVRQILKKECEPDQVSLEAVVELRDFIEQMTIRLAGEASAEMEEYNKGRKRHGLRKKKRLPQWIIKRTTNNVLKKPLDKEMGSRPARIGSPGGNTMSAETDAAKSAIEENGNAGGDADGP